MSINISIEKIDKTAQRPDNYHWLRSEGLEYLQSLSGKIWTDYNTHDPGITILEVLSYALTDLSYRTSFPIEDLLSEEKDNESKLKAHFQTAVRQLPCRPVTINDYRKLLIDIKGVKNAWLEKTSPALPLFADLLKSELTDKRPSNTPFTKVSIRGLYQVILEFDADLSEGGKTEVRKEARLRLHNNRSLCEDFASFSTIKTQEFIICGEIEISADASVEKAEAMIFHEVQNYLAPDIQSYTLSEMLDKGKAIEEIYEGPLYRDGTNLLDHGFIDDDELDSASLRKEISLSDIINIIMNIDGVKAVKNLVIQPYPDHDEKAWNKWHFNVESGHQARLLSSVSKLVHYKDLLPFRASPAAVEQELQTLRQAENDAHDLARIEDIPIPGGKYRNPGAYMSIAGEFPGTYGIGDAGLPVKASDKRKAEARQLKAYLLFFDQALANYLAQLAKIKELFSSGAGVNHTYFTQVVEGVNGMKELYKDFEGLGTKLEGIAESKQEFYKRRNKFLDHLLSRFNEQFSEYASMMYTLSNEEDTNAGLAHDKASFLRDYPLLSTARGTSFNYTDKNELWDTTNVPGLQHRVARLTGIDNYSRRNLAKIDYDVYEEKDEDDIIEYRFRIIDKTNDKILISSSTSYLDRDKAVEEMRQGVRLGINLKNYDKKVTADGRFYFNLVDEDRKTIARRIEYFTSTDERDEAIRQLRKLLRERYGGEGMFIVEHLLLRNRKLNDPLMPVCIDKEAMDCPDTDPYSFRLTIILPAWEERFKDIYFRRFIEKTLRLEIPAHIFPRICWLDEEQISSFEDVYKNWLIAHAELPRNEQGYKLALKKLISIMSGMKSVYPEGTLHDCIDGEDNNPVVLGSTTLGSMETG